MTTLLCASSHCRLPGIHAEDCDDEQCGGCQRARAADGLYLCGHDAARIPKDALKAAQLHAALGQVLGGSTGARGPGGNDIGLRADPVAIEARSAIRNTLAGLCRLVAEERGHELPDDTVLAMARFLVINAEWLAAHPAAGEHAGDLRDIATDGRSWAAAYPVRGDRTLIGVCNQARSGLSEVVAVTIGATEACGTPLWHRDGDEALTCPACGTTGTVQWWRWEMCSAGEREGIVDAYAGAAYLSWRWDRLVDPALVRKWGQRHGLTLRALVRDDDGQVVDGPLLRDHLGRVLFALGELEARAVKVWGDPHDTLAKVGAAT